MGDYITTYTKVHFTPTGPKCEDIKIEDIAHALSMMTRANGHFPEFHSVAQHCIECADEARARGYAPHVVLACLLHDAQEAYLADVTRPIKKYLDKYREIEDNLQNAIFARFGITLTDEERNQVSEVDDTMLYYEFYHYMGESISSEPPIKYSEPQFVTLPFGEVEQAYLDMFGKIKKEI